MKTFNTWLAENVFGLPPRKTQPIQQQQALQRGIKDKLVNDPSAQQRQQDYEKGNAVVVGDDNPHHQQQILLSMFKNTTESMQKHIFPLVSLLSRAYPKSSRVQQMLRTYAEFHKAYQAVFDGITGQQGQQ
jgi:sulfite reductase alpha subunit-like flavoprotein